MSPSARMSIARVSRRFVCGTTLGLLLAGLAKLKRPRAAPAADFHLPPKTTYRTAIVNGHSIFYREAGDASASTLVLLHGYPSSSHTYRELIPMLSRYHRVIAPDYLGSGYSDRPDPDGYTYTFDRLTDHVEELLQSLGVTRYALYMQDFGAPVGFRLIVRHPERVTAIIVQNANAYLDGLTDARRAFFRKAHDDDTPANIAALYGLVSREAVIERQYLRDVPIARREIMSPDSWTHDLAFLQAEKDRKIQVQLFQDYQSNIDAYGTWQQVLRQNQFPALIVWGERDPAFVAAGAKAYLRDLPNAELHLIDAGHFAVEEKAPEIARYVLSFVEKLR
jgi:pimeloyl-ACP methyl ester carboxylesterase